MQVNLIEARTAVAREMENFTSQDLQKKPGQVQEAALRAPIVITHHRRKRLVMLSIEEFERLRHLATEPQAFKLDELDDRVLTQIVDAHMDPRHADLDALMGDE